MNKQAALQSRPFGKPDRWFKDINARACAVLTQAGSDIALIISAAGAIEDFAYRDPGLRAFIPETWIGARWERTVTPECIEKIQELLADSGTQPVTRRRQVNHPATGKADLPVDYALVSFGGSPFKVALGNDLRKIADVQTRLVQAQLEMEREYRTLRRTETRYRILFQSLTEPVVIVDASGQQIVDINLAAARLLNTTPVKAAGERAASLFTRASRDAVANAVELAGQQGAPHSIEVALAADGRRIMLMIEPFRDDGEINFILRLDAQPAALGSTTNDAHWDADTLLRNLPEAVVVTDAGGNIEEVNNRFLDLVRALNRDAAVGRHLETWLGASPVDLQVLMASLRDRDETRNFTTVLSDDYGGSRAVQISARRLSGGSDGPIGYLITDAPSKDVGIATRTNHLTGDTSEVAELVGRVPLKELVREASEMIERMCIESALRQTKNNRASAADMLGLSRQSLYVKLRRHGLEQFDPGN